MRKYSKFYAIISRDIKKSQWNIYVLTEIINISNKYIRMHRFTLSYAFSVYVACFLQVIKQVVSEVGSSEMFHVALLLVYLDSASNIPVS